MTKNKLSLEKIVVTSPSFSRNDILKKEIYSVFSNVVLNERDQKLEGDTLIEYIKDADGIIVGLEKMGKHILSTCQNIKIISKYGVGLDNIDLEYCKERGIVVVWTPGVNKISVAEMTLAFMIMLGRRLHSISIQLKNGVWSKNGGFDLYGKVVGIIGVGNIGKEVVKLLKPFRCNVMVNDIIDQKEYYKENDLIESSKNEIFRNADFVTLHTPLSGLTKNLINRDVLSSMKKSAYLINTARGQIVNSNDLKWALKNGIIAGAALDVYDEEPPEDSELLKLENLICTPHIGGNSYESILAMGRAAIDHLRDFFIKNNFLK